MPALHPINSETLAKLVCGACEVVHAAAGLIPWRLPAHLEPFLHPALTGVVKATTGVHLRFQSACRTFRLEFDQEGAKIIETGATWEILVDGILHTRQTVSTGKRVVLQGTELPARSKEVVVCLPPNARITLIGFSSDFPVFPAEPQGPQWITHGSSITRCANSHPSESWPWLVAKELGWRSLNLGFSGECKFDPVVARAIARIPADRISLCLGINSATGSFSLRTWIPAIEGFLLTIRDGHPRTPLLVISPILSPPRETWDEAPCRIGLQTMRRILEETVEKFRASGDRHIHYLDGLRLIGPGDESCLPDKLHPDAEGVLLLARRFLEHMPGDWAQGREINHAGSPTCDAAHQAVHPPSTTRLCPVM